MHFLKLPQYIECSLLFIPHSRAAQPPFPYIIHVCLSYNFHCFPLTKMISILTASGISQDKEGVMGQLTSCQGQGTNRDRLTDFFSHHHHLRAEGISCPQLLLTKHVLFYQLACHMLSLEGRQQLSVATGKDQIKKEVCSQSSYRFNHMLK